MQVPGLVAQVVEAADKAGAALMIEDQNRRILLSNAANDDLFPYMDFRDRPDYTQLFRSCLEKRAIPDPSAYQDPDHWLMLANEFRHRNDFATFIRRRDDRIIMAYFERLEGFGAYFARIDVTNRLGADMPPLFGPGFWNGSFSLAPDLSLARGFLTASMLPAALLTADGIILETNRRFDDLLARRDPLTIIADRLAVPAQRDTAYRAALRNATLGVAGLIRLPRRAEGWIALQVSHLARHWAGPLVLVQCLDPEEEPTVDPDVVGDLYELTNAERVVVGELGRGSSAEEVATQTGVQRNTVYRHIKSIFAKTGFRRQSDLVRLTTQLAALATRRRRR